LSTASEASSRPSLTWIGWILGGAVDRPRWWNMRFIGRFMIALGAISSVFDF